MIMKKIFILIFALFISYTNFYTSTLAIQPYKIPHWIILQLRLRCEIKSLSLYLLLPSLFWPIAPYTVFVKASPFALSTEWAIWGWVTKCGWSLRRFSDMRAANFTASGLSQNKKKSGGGKLYYCWPPFPVLRFFCLPLSPRHGIFPLCLSTAFHWAWSGESYSPMWKVG